jgi:hypothetical protein
MVSASQTLKYAKSSLHSKLMLEHFFVSQFSFGGGGHLSSHYKPVFWNYTKQGKIMSTKHCLNEHGRSLCR